MSLIVENPKYFEYLSPSANRSDIQAIRLQAYKDKIEKHSENLALSELIRDIPVISSFEVQKTIPTFGDANACSDQLKEQSLELMKKMSPWKKGPLSVYDTYIDSEWRSDWKWNRIAEVMPEITNHFVADIGCSNGYFMFRMLEQNPKFVLGMDPYGRAGLKFKYMKKLSGRDDIDFEWMGAEHAEHFSSSFDTVFCLGVLYHHTDPMALLRSMYKSLKKDGTLIIECQGIPGELPISLTPRKRYAQARGIWFLPTQSCLHNWIARAQFRDIECFYNEPLSTEEQRRTEWADIDSLKDFLDPKDESLTIEGYPAPQRIYFKARK